MAVILVQISRHHFKETLGLFHDHFVRGLAARGAHDSRLDGQDRAHHALTLLRLVVDIGIFMHTKDLGIVSNRQGVDIIHIGGQVAYLGDVVGLGLGEEVGGFQDFSGDKESENTEETSSVPVIGDSATVIDMPDHEREGIPRGLGLFIEKHFQDRSGGFEVRIVEFVADVPA